ncbi:uncharacterized protein LOC124167264 isoform X2 [Ischnura elegans]|uniref:uncharacterized protein LOC124167264 isoform X2 n=1 Tax=Ischnura elegans TaxID=197161 RepID=UPI001ED89959|nr:uncharacterized protein LOC124167264 isoform X2 [Ischnura elegans]
MARVALLAVVCLGLRAHAQRAPCYECEEYKDAHPESNPYGQDDAHMRQVAHEREAKIRSHCTYPCECPGSDAVKCPPGVTVVRDGCGCCEVCARQRGESCDGSISCDPRKGLMCQFPTDSPTGSGTCQGLPCTVQNRTYENGETFLLDCRTQCSCQNGTYACASLCPQESISPRGTSCLHPRLVEVQGQCCREWMCDSVTAQRPPPPCNARFTEWSDCSSTCGLGLSTRVISKENNTQVEPLSSSEGDCGAPGGVEVRLCQEKPCNPEDSALLPLMPQSHPLKARHHHIRKGHECKATQRPSGPVRLRVGPCRSRKRFRPRSCGNCPGACCRPVLTHTIRVLFACATRRGHPLPEGSEGTAGEEQLVGGWGGRWLPAPPASLLSLARPGSDLWLLEPNYKKKKEPGREQEETTTEPLPPPAYPVGAPPRSKPQQRGGSSTADSSEDNPSNDEEEASSMSAVGAAGGSAALPPPGADDDEDDMGVVGRAWVRRRLGDAGRWGRRPRGRRRRRSVASRRFEWSSVSESEELVTLSVQWIVRCKCTEPCPAESAPTTPGAEEEDAEEEEGVEEEEGESSGERMADVAEGAGREEGESEDMGERGVAVQEREAAEDGGAAGEYEVDGGEEESEDGDKGDSEEDDGEEVEDVRVVNRFGEVILHRVHRMAKP